MASEELKETEGALSRRLLPEIDPEDPDRCEIHRYMMTRTARFVCPGVKEEWLSRSRDLRHRFLKEVYFRGHSLRLLDGPPKIQWRGTVQTVGGYRIRKLLYEGYPGMWIPALLYEPTDLRERLPAVLNTNGHHTGGKAMDYKQARCINLAKRGMLALSTEFIGMGELSNNLPHNRIGHMDLCGSAGVAVFYLAMKRGLDVLLSHPKCDLERVGATGLSGGGWQTIVLGALDERIKVVVPVAGHSPIWQRPSCAPDIGDLEQNPTDFCTVADYDTLTALCAPRPLLLIYNRDDDCCFKAERTRISIYETARPLYKLLGVPDNIEFYENVDPGTHNYGADNRSQLYKFLNKHFDLDTPEEDLPYEGELLSETQLEVGLPDENATQISLAMEKASNLPEMKVPKASGPEWIEWLGRARERLGDLIHIYSYEAYDEIAREEESWIHLRLHMGDAWTVPVTKFLGTRDLPTQVLISDGGRTSLANHVRANLDEGRTVLASDVFGTGESSYPSSYQMTLGALGERPLGILSGQILSLIKWAASHGPNGKAGLTAIGSVTSFASLCAAALDPEPFEHLYLEGLHHSLKRLIELPVEYLSAVPLFCFGLFREFDIRELLAMVEDVPIEVLGRGPIQPIVPR